MKKALVLWIFVGLMMTSRANGGCVACGSLNGGDSQGNQVGPNFSVSLGAAQYGQSAGNLFFSASAPDPSLFTPVALQFDASSRTDVVVLTTNVITTEWVSEVETDAVLVTNLLIQTNFITTVAGSGANYNLSFPSGVAVDAAGDLYIADFGNKVVRKVAANGIISVVAGGGANNPVNGGAATNVSLKLGYAAGLAVDPSGNFYIADSDNNLVEKVNTNGIITVVAGGGTNNPVNGGAATNASLSYPSGVAVDASGNLYIADYDNNLIEKVSTNGIIMVVAGGGANYPSAGSAATNASLSYPSGVAVDGSSNFYIADSGNNLVEKVGANGIITTVLGSGLSEPSDVALDASGNLYIVNNGYNTICRYAGGVMTTVAGNGSYGYTGDGKKATNASLENPSGVAVDASGNFYIADTDNCAIRKVASDGLITTVAQFTARGYWGDGGAAVSAGLNGPFGVALDSSGNLYIADAENDAIREVPVNGTITTVAGNRNAGYSGDSGAATNASLAYPAGVAVDGSGNLYIADSYNNVIRKVVATNGVITTVVGTSTGLSFPSGLVVDSSGNLYIADTGNNIIRKLASGVVTTVVGTSAGLKAPMGLAVDSSGNLYIADTGNNIIRKLASGVVTTVAGNGAAGYSGDNGPATSANLNDPSGVAVDSSGNLYIADTGNYVVRKVNNSGTITTLVGNGLCGYYGDGGLPTNAALGGPFGVALDGSGNVYIADTTNNLVREVSPTGTITNGAIYTFNNVTVTNTTPVLTTNAVIMQVQAPQAIADIPWQPASTNGYVINFYFPSQVTGQVNGLDQFSGQPFVTWVITNSNPSSINQLQISEYGNVPYYGLMKQWTYTYSSATGVWAAQPLGGVFQENLSITNLSATAYQVINSFQSPTGPVVQQAIDTYQTYYWSQCTNVALATNAVGSASAPEITTYTYWDPATFNAGSMVLPDTVTHPDGSWEYYTGYDMNGNPTSVYSSFEDAPVDSTSARRTVYFYNTNVVSGSGDNGTANPTVPRETVEYVNNTIVAQQFTAFPSASERLDIQCTVAGAAWNDSGNLITTNLFYTSGPNQYALEAVIRPDGTLTTYNYLTNGTYETNFTVTGQPDSTGTNYVVDGVSNVTVLNSAGYNVSVATYDVLTGIKLSQDIYANFDSYSRPTQVTHLDGTTEYTSYACCGLESTVDRDYVTTEYLYDPANRQIGYEKIYNGSPITYTNVLDAASRTVQSIRVGSDNSVISLSQSAYDLASELIAQTNALGGVTAYTRTTNSTTGGLIRTITNPDGGTITNFYYADGSLKETIGTAVHGQAYGYGVGTDVNGDYCTYTVVTNLNTDGSLSSEWTQTYSDMAGRTTEVLYADGHYSQSFYNAQGQLSKQTDPDGVVTLYQYNAKGQLAYTAIAMTSGETSINFGGADRITYNINDVTTDHGANVQRARTYTWGTLNSNTSNLVSMVETSVEGLTNWQTAYRDASTPVTNLTQTSYASGGSRTTIVIAPDNSYTINTFSYSRLLSSTRYNSGGTQISGTTYTYDPDGRQSTVTDARNGATTYGYNNADLVTSLTTPNPGGIGGSPENTTTIYNTMLQATSVNQPDGTTVSSAYLPTGELGLQSGSRTYPVAYSYDYAGRMQTMTNWSNFAGNSGARVTTWKYDGHRGWLTNKVYAGATAGPSYTYTPAGRLATRLWARGITTTYNYDISGSVTNVNYSDGVTSGVTNRYDRLGRLSTNICNGITDTLTYNLANQLLGESFSGGILNGLAVTNGYDADLRRTTLVALSSGSSLLSANYSYDNASRLSSVTDGNNNSAAYSYVANSPLVSQITFKQSGTTRVATTKQYDYLNRLTSISSAPSATNTVSFNYSYNNANQRVRDTLADGSYWIYQYDSLGQVIGANKYWSDETPVAGQQFDYAFDTIGNRTQTQTGGDQNGGYLRTANYTNNTLNQITSRDVPSYVDVKGVSFATNTVTVNGNTAYRKTEYFRNELAVNNSSKALWTNIVTAATGQTSVTGNVYVAQEPEVFNYDADGNLTNDGRWAYTWDGENRLVKMTVNTNVGPQYQLTFAYDSQGRRIQKLVSSNSVAIYTSRFLYDGWNLVAVLNPSSLLVDSFMWGSDLSGSQQGAGGVGGLLEISYNGSSTTNCFPAFDGNGNVAALINAADGTVTANYEYGPFGEVIRSTGLMAKNNPFRFSTKYDDDESDLLYYGYRCYKPSTGTWPNRDPYGEPGFELLHISNPAAISEYSIYQCPSCKSRAVAKIKMATNEPNFYCFDQNTPIEQVDALGLWATLDTSGCSDHASDINNAWNTVQQLISNNINNPPIWAGALFDCMAQDHRTVHVSCHGLNDCVRCWLTGAPATIGAAGGGTTYLCNSAFSSPCQLGATLGVEVSKLDCGVTAVSQEIPFSGWLSRHLCNH